MNSMDPRPPSSRPPSTGNDIVALSATDRERTTRPRFYSRILDAGEQTLYDSQALAGLSFDNYVWLLWSVKESVYKYQQRNDPGLLFSPAKIPIRQLVPSPKQDFYRGTVVYGYDTLYSRSVIRDGVIATVVSNQENFENTRWGFESITASDHAHQSAAVRASVTRELNAALSGSNLQIGKSPYGYPVILNGEERLDIPVSLAHHDRWVAWSFLLPAATPPASGMPATPQFVV